jgi:primase-polymerase (primpol)-like protein
MLLFSFVYTIPFKYQRLGRSHNSTDNVSWEMSVIWAHFRWGRKMNNIEKSRGMRRTYVWEKTDTKTNTLHVRICARALHIRSPSHSLSDIHTHTHTHMNLKKCCRMNNNPRKDIPNEPGWLFCAHPSVRMHTASTFSVDALG